MPWSVTVRRNDISKVRAAVAANAEKSVRDSAHHMRDHAQAIAPVRTGAFRASLYVNGPNNESDYFVAAARAKELNPAANIIPEQSAAGLDANVGRLRNVFGQFSLPEAIMGSAVEYSVYLEDGTVHMAPQPVFRPASLVAERFFRDAMSTIASGF